MAGRHVRPPDPNAPPVPPPRVDRRVILGAALVILAAVVAVLVIKLHVLGGGDAAAPGPTTPRATSTKTPSVTNGSPSTTVTSPVTSPTATISPSVKPTTKPSPSVKPTTKPTPTPTPTPTKTVQPPPPAPRYPLLVLNNSTVTGLGTAAANDFEAGGWTISGVGNLTGRLRDTTVYFDPGYEASAQALARQFPQLHRVLPRIHGLPGTSKLTVVVTRYYEPGGGK